MKQFNESMKEALKNYIWTGEVIDFHTNNDFDKFEIREL